MTDLVWAVAGIAVSLAIMYLVCLRPMRRRRADRGAAGQPSAELARLRQEVSRLREQAGAAPHDTLG